MMDDVVDINQGAGASGDTAEDQAEAKPNGHDPAQREGTEPDGAAVAKKEEAAKKKRMASLTEHQQAATAKDMETIICQYDRLINVLPHLDDSLVGSRATRPVLDAIRRSHSTPTGGRMN